MKPGSIAYDTDHGCVAVFMDQLYGVAYLRPIGGGVEWTVDSTQVRPASPTEVAAAQGGFLKAPSPPVVTFTHAVEPCTVPCKSCKGAGRQ